MDGVGRILAITACVTEKLALRHSSSRHDPGSPCVAVLKVRIHREVSAAVSENYFVAVAIVVVLPKDNCPRRYRAHIQRGSVNGPELKVDSIVVGVVGSRVARRREVVGVTMIRITAAYPVLLAGGPRKAQGRCGAGPLKR